VEFTAEDVCPECGERNPPDSAFCVFCGAYLGWDERAPADEETTLLFAPPVTEPLRPADYPPPSPTPVPQPEPVTTRLEPVASSPQPSPVVSEPAAPACPACGYPNDASRRFCAKCGQPLRPAHLGAPAEPQPTQMPGFWQRLFDPLAREARRNYRHSLSWWRRWRRVALSAIGVAVVAALIVALQNHPVDRAKDLLNIGSSPTQPANTGKATGHTKHGSATPKLTAPYPGRPLSIKIRGTFTRDVRRVQQALSDNGYRIAVDGDFGPQTKSIVTKYQHANNLAANGIVGPKTWASLFARPQR
jgi:hypothetical protein